METFLRTQSVALTEQGHASESTLFLDPADVSAAFLVTGAWRVCDDALGGETASADAFRRPPLSDGEAHALGFALVAS